MPKEPLKRRIGKKIAKAMDVPTQEVKMVEVGRTDMQKFIKLKQIIAEKEAENLELTTKIDILERKEEKASEKEQEAIIKDAREAKKRLGKPGQRSIFWQLRTPSRRLPIFYMKDNRIVGPPDYKKPFPYLWGIEEMDTPDGFSIFYVILTDREGKNRVKIPRHVTCFSDIWKENVGNVGQLTGGKLDSNFILENSHFLLAKESERVVEIQEEIKKIKGKKVSTPPKEEKVRIVDMAAYERREYQVQIAELTDTSNKYYSQLEDSKKRQARKSVELQDTRLALHYSGEETKTYKSITAATMEKSLAIERRYGEQGLILQNALYRVSLQEDISRGLVKALENARDMYADQLGLQASEVERERLIRQINTFNGMIKQLQSLVVPQQPRAPAAAPKGEG